MEPMTALAVGSLVGFVSGFFGVGGGFLMVPVLVSLGVPVHEALGTTLLAIGLGSLPGAFKHFKEGNVHGRVAASLGLSAVLGAQIGGFLACDAPGYLLKTILGVACAGMAVRMFYGDEGEKDRKGSSLVPAAAGLGVGTLSGMTGSGGGVLFVPVMSTFMGMRTAVAVGTSSVVVPVSSLTGASEYWIHGFVNLWSVPELVTGMLVTSYLGAKVSQGVDDGTLRRVFALILGGVGAKMILSGMAGA
ncbi:MAG: sulfite exporter TauE/SafE family protein [Methanopyri archaeon]|nr:sulfite exporter TauE/SafE family protein [Methanopyri archaeon]